MKPSYEDLDPEDRAMYRRLVGGLFAFYAALLFGICAVISLQVMRGPMPAPAPSETASATSPEPIAPAPLRQAVKYD